MENFAFTVVKIVYDIQERSSLCYIHALDQYESLCTIHYRYVRIIWILQLFVVILQEYHIFCVSFFRRAKWHSSVTLTEVFPCFFVSCKANARV